MQIVIILDEEFGLGKADFSSWWDPSFRWSSQQILASKSWKQRENSKRSIKKSLYYRVWQENWRRPHRIINLIIIVMIIIIMISIIVYILLIFLLSLIFFIMMIIIRRYFRRFYVFALKSETFYPCFEVVASHPSMVPWSLYLTSAFVDF